MDLDSSQSGIKKLLTAGELLRFFIYLASLVAAFAVAASAMSSRIEEIDEHGSKALQHTTERVETLEKAIVRIETHLENIAKSLDRLLERLPH